MVLICLSNLSGTLVSLYFGTLAMLAAPVMAVSSDWFADSMLVEVEKRLAQSVLFSAFFIAW